MTSQPSRARIAYDTLEPFHVLAYFSPKLRGACQATGLDQHAFYVGARGAPLGDCAPAVVASAFFNFAPGPIATSWEKALACGLDRVSRARYAMLNEQLIEILGDRSDDQFVATASEQLRSAAATLPMSGRPLAAAWAAAPEPTEPLARLWHNIAVVREWRGDNHIAALVLGGLNGIDAVSFHEAQLPDPTIRRRVLGRDLTLLTRIWTEQEWDDSIDRLASRGLVERTDDGHRLTPEGGALYDDIEATTDALGEQFWSAPELIAVVEGLRPYVKSVIDAGVLPGTRKKS